MSHLYHLDANILSTIKRCSSWWFQPIWKNSKIGSFPQDSGWKSKNIWVATTQVVFCTPRNQRKHRVGLDSSSPSPIHYPFGPLGGRWGVRLGCSRGVPPAWFRGSTGMSFFFVCFLAVKFLRFFGAKNKKTLRQRKSMTILEQRISRQYPVMVVAWTSKVAWDRGISHIQSYPNPTPPQHTKIWWDLYEASNLQKTSKHTKQISPPSIVNTWLVFCGENTAVHTGWDQGSYSPHKIHHANIDSCSFPAWPRGNSCRSCGSSLFLLAPKNLRSRTWRLSKKGSSSSNPSVSGANW